MNRVAGRALLIGVYSAAVVLAPSPAAAAFLAAPILLIPLAWWLLPGIHRWMAAFLASAILLPPLPIPLGNSGPHPSLVFAFAGLGIGLLRARQWSFPRNALSRSLLLFFAVLLASTASAAVYGGMELALGSLVRVALFGISVYIYFYVAHGPGRFAALSQTRALRWLLACATLATAFACVDFYFQFPAPAGYGAQFIWLSSGVYRRAQGLFYEASTLGNFCVFFLVLLAASLSAPAERRIIPRHLAALSAAVLFGALVLSYSRGSIAALCASLFTLLLLQARRLQLRYSVLVLPLSLAAGAIGLYLYLPSFGETYLRRMTGSLEFFFTDTNGILSGRIESWRAIVTLLQEHPGYFLFGIGYKTLPYVDLTGKPLVADNMYLSLLIETGVAGLVTFLWMNLCLVRTALRAARSTDPSIALLGTWFTCFWAGELLQMMTGDLFTYWRVLPLYFWVIASASRSHEHPVR